MRRVEAGTGSQSPFAVAGDRPLNAPTAKVAANPPGGSPRAEVRSPTAPALRPYQLEALTAIRAEFSRGCRSTLLELPTGTGKTVCFAALAKEWVDQGERVLVLAHREELLDQAVEKLTAIGLWAQIEQGSRRAGSAPVVVASVATLQRDRLARFARSAFSRIIVDEGHHGPAASYRAITDYFENARVLFVTATPDRGDGKALGKICESVAYRYTLKQAIDDGWLVPLRARRILVANVNLAGVSVHHGDFDQRELAGVFGDEKALHGTAVPLLELSGTRRTIAFCVDVAHARALADVLNRYEPGCARAVDGSAKKDERRAFLRAFRAGEFRILVNCALYTEGFDEPSIGCVAVVRPTKSRALYVQMLGRGTRLLGLSYALSVAAGKAHCLVLDFVGNSGRHKLVGPVDALAGNDNAIDDDHRDVVQELLETRGEQLALEDVLAMADDELAKRRRGLEFTAIAEYRTKEIDPFLGDFFRPNPDGAWSREPVTDKQRALLKREGIEKLPEGLTAGEASKWIDACAQRERLGLPSFKLARALERANLNTKGMTAVRANQLWQKLRAVGFKHPFLRGEPEYKPGWKRKPDPYPLRRDSK